MAVTKLRADAPPFRLSPSCHLQFPTPPPPHLMAVSRYHPVPCSPSFPVVPTNPLPPFPVVPAYPLPPFPGPAAPPIYGIPWPPHPPAPVSFPGKVVPPPPRRKARVAFLRPRKGVYSPRPRLPAGTEAFLVKANPLPPPAPLSSKDVPSPPPTPKKIALLSREALPHGTPPHKLMLLLGGGAVADKLRAKAAAATMACAAESVMPGRQDLAPAPAAGPRHGRLVAPPGSLLGPPPRAAWSGGGKVKGVGRRQAKSPAGSPSPSFTTSPPYPITGPEWRKEPVTTVMIRNIPNKLKPCEMVQLLDEHCTRANGRKKKKAAAVVAAYDFVYLPMDFSKCSSNMGYAFVNLTTAEAARGLHYALHGARWKVHGTKKVIHICAARIQGKEALVSHFSGSTFPCHTDEYLPAAFSPPRDGASASAAVTPPPTATHVGTRVHRPAPPAPRPLLPVPPPPQQLEWRRVERVVVHEAA